MHPKLSWLSPSLLVSVSISALISFGCSSADLNVFDAQRFEECVNTVLSQYPFLTKEDRWRMDKIVQKSTYRLKKDPTRLIEGKEIRHFGRKLATLMIVNDTWRDSREVAYVSAIERCSMLITGTPDNEIQNEALFYFLSHENGRISVTGEDISKLIRMKFNKPFSLTSDTELNLKRRSKRDVGLFSTFPQPINNQRQSRVETRVAFVIRDILLKSPVFAKAFHVGLPQKDAIAISTDITEAGLKYFARPIINDAVRAVINDMSFTTLSSNNENYAFIICRAVAETIRRYNLTLFDDGAQIARSMISEIETLLGSQGPNTQIPIQENIQQPNSDFKVNREATFTQTILNQQPPNFNPVMGIPMIQPSPVTMLSPENSASKFQIRLVPLLTQSDEILNLFCKASSPDIFRTIKTALSNYGPIVSVNAAVTAADAFSQFNPQQLCSQYAEIISKIIGDVLFDNGLIEMADPSEIVKNFISSAKAYSGSPLTVPQNPSTQISRDFNGSFPLLPSFSEITAPEFPQSFEKLKYPNEEKNPGMSESSEFKPLVKQPNTDKMEDYSETKADLPVDASPISSANHFQATALQPEPLNQSSKVDAFAKAVIPASKSDLLPPVPTYKTPQSSSIIPANKVNDSMNVSEFPIPLEAGPLISGSLPVVEGKFPPASLGEFAPITTMAPFLSTDSMTTFTSASQFLSTSMEFPTTTLDPYVKNLTDAIGEPSKLSELFMDGIASLRALSSQDSSPRNEDSLKLDKNESLLAVDITANNKPFNAEELKTTPVSNVSQESDSIDMNNSKEITAAVSSVSGSGPQPAANPVSGNGNSSSVSAAVFTQIDPVIRASSVELKSNFNPTSVPSIENKSQRKETQNSDLSEKVLQISESAIVFIKSPDFNLQELCSRLNEVSNIVGIEPVPADNCSGISVTDYLLHVLKVVTSTMRST